MNLLYIFSRELDYALGWTIIHSFWQTTLCALLLSLIVVLYPKRKTRMRYLFANASLFLVLCCSVATFIYQSHKAKQRFNVVYIPATKSQEIEKGGTGDAMSGAPAEETGTFSTLRQTTASFNEYFNRHFPLIVMIWAFGVCLFVMKLLSGVTYIYYLKQRMNFSPAAHWLKVAERLARSAGVQRTIALVESVLVRGPVVVGFFKPMILLPFGLLNKLTQEEAEAVLAHEIAHILRQDYLFNIIQSIIEALFYYHPAVWWISSIIRNERESACDEMAIRMTGNAVNYAKALVAVQEITYYPASTAMAFAGSGKSQFMHRIERILNVQKHKRNHLEKIVTVLCTFILLGVLAFSQKLEKPNMPSVAPGTRLQENSNASGLSGIWQATIQGNNVCITFSNGVNGSMWLSNECFDRSAFSRIPETVAPFTIAREPGTIHFTGKFEGNKGYGSYVFSVNGSYRRFLKDQGINDISDEAMLHAFLTNFNREMIGKLKRNGYNTITGKQFSDLAVHAVNEKELDGYLKYFREIKEAPGNIDKITSLKKHGVNTTYIENVKGQGIGQVGVEELLKAKIHGVEPDYIERLKRIGYDKLTMNEIIELKVHGVEADYITGLNKISNDTLTALRIIDAAKHGIDPGTAVKVPPGKGGGNSYNEIKKLTIHGVNAAYAENMNNAGLGTLTNDQLFTAKTNGIDAEYVKSMTALHIDELDFDHVVTCKIHAIDAGYIRGLQESGLNLSIDKIIQFKIQDVTPAYIRSFKPVFGRNLSEKEAIEFRTHEVKASFIEEFRKYSLGDIQPESALQLKILDITPQYVEYLKNKGIDLHAIDDVIACRKRGV